MDRRGLAAAVMGAVFLAWSPAAAAAQQEIAFVSARDGDPEIFVMNGDGTNVRQLTHNTVIDGSPEWSPDGTLIAFDRVGGTAGAGAEGPPRDVFVMHADGSGELNLTATPALHEMAPTWSPDGGRIAFHTTRDGELEIYSMAADGTDLVNLTNRQPTGPDPTSRAGADVKPAWSPDGRTILFESYRDGSGLNSDIWLMDADGADPRPVISTPFPAPEWYPAWSPSGRRIAYMGARNGKSFDIYVARVDGGRARNLTANLKTEQHPAWAPGGRRLAFDSNLGDGGFDTELIGGRYYVAGDPTVPDNFEIYTIRADGTGLKRLTDSPGLDEDPDYRPHARSRGANGGRS